MRFILQLIGNLIKIAIMLGGLYSFGRCIVGYIYGWDEGVNQMYFFAYVIAGLLAVYVFKVPVKEGS